MTSESKLTSRKKIKIIIAISIISVIIALFIGELFLAVFNPQPHLHPRLSYSEQYRTIPYPNVIMEHYVFPSKRYYSTNQYGHRGKAIAISNKYDKPNILLLGDSYTFGIGVNDGEEWGSILANKLQVQYNIINTGVGGWGLTQQIRRYYEFGQLFKPEAVIILFCLNDPVDNFTSYCTKIENGRFTFIDFYEDDNKTIYLLNKYLSKSFLQKSNLLTVLASTRWQLNKKNRIETNKKKVKDAILNVPLEESFYNELFNVFSEDLYSNNIKTYFISVNSLIDGNITSHLDNFPHIKKNIQRLDSLNIIDYINIDSSFTKKDMNQSPVGHYDIEWNLRLGSELAKYIKNTKR